jgi:tRNA-dihydrouridine synthase
LGERRRLILNHFRLLAEQEDDRKLILHKLRTFTGWYTHGLVGGRQLRMRINSLHTPEAFVGAVEQFFDRAQVAA